jgi:hypothetical protein
MISDAQNYADFVWLAIRLLKDAGAEIKKKKPETVTFQEVEDAVNGAIVKVLENYSPGSERVRRLSDLEPTRPLYSVSFNALDGLTGQDGLGKLFSLYGEGWRASDAKTTAQALKNRILALGQQMGIYAPGSTGAGPKYKALRRAVGPGEDFSAATTRWNQEDQFTRTVQSPPVPQASVPAPMPTSVQASTAAQAPETRLPAPTAPTSLPSWAVPALGAAAILGVGLLLLPDGSGNSRRF